MLENLIEGLELGILQKVSSDRVCFDNQTPQKKPLQQQRCTLHTEKCKTTVVPTDHSTPNQLERE